MNKIRWLWRILSCFVLRNPKWRLYWRFGSDYNSVRLVDSLYAIPDAVFKMDMVETIADYKVTRFNIIDRIPIDNHENLS